MAREPTKKPDGKRAESAFSSEDEEARYWAEHELSNEMLESMEPLADDPFPPPRLGARPGAL